MNDQESEALEAASLEPIYRRLFHDQPRGIEFPEYERKDYFLSADVIARDKETLIETITGIANLGRAGLIMCRGRGQPPPLQDAERLDQMVRAAVFPYPAFTVERTTISGDVLDVVIIPQSPLRPHFVKASTGSNRFFIPLRGAANNATAARHEVDEMYRSWTVETIRRAFPSLHVQADATDTVLEYAAEIGYGLEQENRIPEVAHLLIPEPLQRELIPRQLISPDADRNIHNTMANASAAVANKGYRDYFPLGPNTSLGNQYGEDYVEFYQVYSNKESPYAPFWGTRLYRSGAVTRRSIVASYPRTGGMWLSWFVEQLRATMLFADTLYSSLNIPIGSLRILSVLRGFEDANLMVPGLFNTDAPESPTSMHHLTILPERYPIRIPRAELIDDPNGNAKEIGRLLRLRYERSPGAL